MFHNDLDNLNISCNANDMRCNPKKCINFTFGKNMNVNPRYKIDGN